MTSKMDPRMTLPRLSSEHPEQIPDGLVQQLQQRLRYGLPQTLGIELVELAYGRLVLQMQVQEKHLAVNGYLHAGAVVTLADTSAGFGCFAHLPQGAMNFTTIELKSNFLGTATQGLLHSEAELRHAGRTTQVWDATVRSAAGKTVALFRCTQMLLYPR